MKLVPAITLGIVCGMVAGCQASLTLAEAQALCTKQHGLLIVVYSQEVTRTRVGPLVAKPGRCVSPTQFKDTDAAAPAQPPAKPGPATAN